MTIVIIRVIILTIITIIIMIVVIIIIIIGKNAKWWNMKKLKLEREDCFPRVATSPLSPAGFQVLWD